MKIEITPDEALEFLNGLNKILVERMKLIIDGVIEQEQIKKEKEDDLNG